VLYQNPILGADRNSSIPPARKPFFPTVVHEIAVKLFLSNLFLKIMSMTQSDKTKQNPVIYFQPTPCIDPITHLNNENKCAVVAMVEFISK